MFFFSSRRRHTRSLCDWSSDVCSSDLIGGLEVREVHQLATLARGEPTGLHPFLNRLRAASRVPGQLRHREHRSEEHTSELQSHSDLVCRLLLEKKKQTENNYTECHNRG